MYHQLQEFRRQGRSLVGGRLDSRIVSEDKDLGIFQVSFFSLFFQQPDTVIKIFSVVALLGFLASPDSNSESEARRADKGCPQTGAEGISKSIDNRDDSLGAQEYQGWFSGIEDDFERSEIIEETNDGNEFLQRSRVAMLDQILLQVGLRD